MSEYLFRLIERLGKETSDRREKISLVLVKLVFC